MRRRAFIPHCTMMRLQTDRFTERDIYQWFAIAHGSLIWRQPNPERMGIEIRIEEPDDVTLDQRPWDTVHEELWDDGEGK